MYFHRTARIGFASMSEADLPAFVEVYASNTYYLSFLEPDASIDLERMRKEWREDSTLPTWHAAAFYRLADDQPVGFVYFVEQHPRLGIPHIGLFVIDGRLHGQGLGTEALNGLLDYMVRTKNWQSVRLGVIAENQPALAFWKARGFELCGESIMDLLHGPTRILVMTRQLP